MEIEKLYFLIHSLSKSQRANLSRLYPAKKRTQVMDLFRRIYNEKSLNGDTESKIRGNKFKNSGKYYSYRAALAELIIKSLVIEETDSISVPQIPFIRRAFLEEATPLATRTLANEMTKAQKTEEFGLSLRYYDFIDEMQFFYGIKIEPLEKLKTFEEISAEKVVRNEFLSHLASIRSAVRLSKTERLVIAARIESNMSIEYWSRTNSDLALKIKVNLCLIRGKYKEGFRKAEVLLKRMMDWREKYPPSMVAAEVRVLALYAVETGHRDWANKLSMTLSTISSRNQFERKVIQKATVFVGVTIAESYGIMPVALVNLEIIVSNPDLFEPKLKRILLFFLALCGLYNADHAFAAKIMNLVRQEPTSDSSVLAWEPELVLAICHFELGNANLAESMIRAASRSATSFDSQYARFVTKIIPQIFHTNNREVAACCETRMEQLIALLSIDSEREYTKFFNVQPWLQSKISNRPAKDFLPGNLKFDTMQSLDQ